MIKCLCCETSLSDEAGYNLKIEDRIQCPQCGSKNRLFHNSISEKITTLDNIKCLTEGEGKHKGYTESAINGRANTADLQADDSVNLALEGSSPQGEESTHKVCEMLKEKLNKINNSNWHDVITDKESATKIGIKLEEPADGIIIDAKNQEIFLEVQVVKAITDSKFWKELSNKHHKDENLTIDQAIDHLKKSIELKKKILPEQRKNLILALDATMIAGIAFKQISEQFHITEGAWAKSLGFKDIWLVGPTIELTHQLTKP